MPTDEQSKSMLYAALKLRLSLVGSMLATICSSDSTTLEWTMLLMQLICSGAVDRQTDSRCVRVDVCELALVPGRCHFCVYGRVHVCLILCGASL